VSGVPFFIFNQKFAVSGAQQTEIMLKALDAASGAIAL
jgi:predicted DsbA family dithiol-disulfide isomerase